MDTVKIGGFIATLRKEKGMTQSELGEALGVTNKTVSRWETGVYMPDVEMLALLSQQFEVNINELLAGERLPEETYRVAADNNVQSLSRDKKRWTKRWIWVCAAILVVALLCAATAITSIRLYQSTQTLYPKGTDDALYAKTYVGDVAIAQRSAENMEYKMAQGIKVGYAPLEPIGDKSFWGLTVEPKEKETVAIYGDIVSYPQRVRNAYAYDLSHVALLGTDIYSAGQARITRAQAGLPANAMGKEGRHTEGHFYGITGDLDGYMSRDYTREAELGVTVWAIYIERPQEGYRYAARVYICIVDAEWLENDEEKQATFLCDWLGNLTFADIDE